MHQQSPCWNHFPSYMQWCASVSGLDMPRSCSFHHQKPLPAARYSPALDVTKPSRSLEKVCDPYSALPHVKQIKTLILKGCGNSRAICPPFLLPAHNLDARGLAPAGRLLEVLTAVTSPPRRTRMPLVHRHDSKNLHWASAHAILTPFLVEMQISRVQGSFFCYTAAEGKNKLNYVKEETLAKELLSSPVPWHKKQINWRQKARSMQKKPRSGNAKVKMSVLTLPAWQRF